MKKTLSVIIGIIVILTIFYLYNKQACFDNTIENTWRGYKYYFIADDGRVLRVKNNDTVSEAQAYAMLRAVWMNDKKTFDKCYRWSEDNLSRSRLGLDNLLAWQWKDGKISDSMPAADADIDYALSLIFAHSLWNNRQPEGLLGYKEKAQLILSDILKRQTYRTASGRLYLAPWILENLESRQRFPVNPSYYSPAHFKIFYQFSQDKRWLDLLDTTYFILDSLSKRFNGQKGVGLIPDWCSVDSDDVFFPLEQKSPDFGWEAVRVPLRVCLDYIWFKSKDAKKYLDNFTLFIEKELTKQGKIFCEYEYERSSLKKYENPLFYAAYFCTLYANGSVYAKALFDKTRLYILKTGQRWIYLNK